MRPGTYLKDEIEENGEDNADNNAGKQEKFECHPTISP